MQWCETVKALYICNSHFFIMISFIRMQAFFMSCAHGSHQMKIMLFQTFNDLYSIGPSRANLGWIVENLNKHSTILP